MFQILTLLNAWQKNIFICIVAQPLRVQINGAVVVAIIIMMYSPEKTVILLFCVCVSLFPLLTLPLIFKWNWNGPWFLYLVAKKKTNQPPMLFNLNRKWFGKNCNQTKNIVRPIFFSSVAFKVFYAFEKYRGIYVCFRWVWERQRKKNWNQTNKWTKEGKQQ